MKESTKLKLAMVLCGIGMSILLLQMYVLEFLVSDACNFILIVFGFACTGLSLLLMHKGSF